MIKPIIQAPHPQLRQVSEPLPDLLDDQHIEVIKDLRDTFAATANCIGLAAIQLGHPWRAIIVDVTRSRTGSYLMVNPVIVKASEDLQLVDDGCMSVQRGTRHGSTKRPKRLVVQWFDLDSQLTRRQKFTGLLAAAIHHELDHLEGVLFLNRLVHNPARVLL